MNLLTGCPERRVLELFQLKQLSVAQAELISRHVEQCGSCLAVVHELTAGDTVKVTASFVDVAPAACQEVEEVVERGGQRGSRNSMPKEVPRITTGNEITLDQPTRLEDHREQAERSALPKVPGYEILALLGRGGMGVVYQARQLRLKRLVALKMMSATEADQEMLDRFQAEAEAVAHLQHPHIVQIHEVGEYAGRPFLSLEYVEGGNLSQTIRRELPTARRAGHLVETLARAVHFAHQHGIIHRDLKPANVLLTAEGEPKITDFGLAKQLHSQAGHTQTGAVLGTPAYMAPEQARGTSHKIGPAADVYALGAILYELLTGWPPFRGDSVLNVLDRVCSEEPVSPRQSQPKVHRDLETICLKALAKEPERRYATALALAEDLHRFDAGESILARREGVVGKLARKVRRHRAMLTVVVFLLAVVLGVVLWASSAQSSARRLVTLRRTFDARLDALDLNPASFQQLETLVTEWETLAPEEAAEARNRLHEYWARHIEEHVRRPNLDAEDVASLEKALILVREPGLETTLRRALKERLGEWKTVFQVAPPFVNLAEVFDPSRLQHDGEHLLVQQAPLVAGQPSLPNQPLFARPAVRGNVELEAVFAAGWESAAEVGLVLHGGSGHSQPVAAVAFSPNGRVVASAAGADQLGEVIFWDLVQVRQQASWQCDKPGRLSIAFHPRGDLLAVACSSDAEIRLVDPATGQVRDRLNAGTSVTCLAFRPDGGLMATGGGVAGQSGAVTLWDTATWRQQGRILPQKNVITHCAFSDDGRRLATADSVPSVHLWDLSNDKEELNLARVGQSWMGLAPDARTLVVSGFAEGSETFVGHHFGFYDTATGRMRGAHLGMHPGGLTAAAFSPHSKTMAIASAWHLAEIRLVDLASRTSRPFLTGGLPPDGVIFRALSFSADGTMLATGNDRHAVQIWDLASGQLRAALEGQGYHFVLIPAAESDAAGVRPAMLRDARAANGSFRLQIRRQNSVLREQSVRVGQVPSGPLRLTARRQSHRLTLQVNDLPSLEYQDLLPVGGGGEVGLRCVAGTRIERLRASQQDLAETMSPLERGDELLAQGHHGEALVYFRQQASSSGRTEVGQEARLKAATCLQVLQRVPEAAELLETVAAEQGPRWPLAAGCQLLQLRLGEHQDSEAALLLESLANRFPSTDVANLVPPQLQRRLVVDLVTELTEPHHYLTRIPVTHVPDMTLADAIMDFFPSARPTDWGAQMAVIRGYHLAGQLERAARASEEMMESLRKNGGDPLMPLDQYCWIQSDAGKPQAALTRLDAFLGDQGKPRNGPPRLVLNRCRVHLALKQPEEANEDLQEYFHPDNLKAAGPQENVEACLLRGFLLEAQGDHAGAKQSWREGLLLLRPTLPGAVVAATTSWRLSEMSDLWLWSAILSANLSETLSDAEAAEALEEITGRAQSRAMWDPVARIVPLPPTLLRDMLRSPRARECVRQIAFRTIGYGDSLRAPRVMMASALIRGSLFVDECSEEQDELIWKLVNDLLAAHMNGQITDRQLGDLALAWKGASGTLGWKAVEKSLGPSICGPCAYVLGFRYRQLGRPQEARQFFTIARETAATRSVLRRLAETELMEATTR
jgi:WD40 repeat protein/tetratricopeptide (TPR) repeat protein